MIEQSLGPFFYLKIRLSILIQKTTPMPLDTHHLIEQGEVFMTVNVQALTHAHAGAYLVSFH